MILPQDINVLVNKIYLLLDAEKNDMSPVTSCRNSCVSEQCTIQLLPFPVPGILLNSGQFHIPDIQSYKNEKKMVHYTHSSYFLHIYKFYKPTFSEEKFISIRQ